MSGPWQKECCPKCKRHKCECRRKKRPVRYADRRRIADLLEAEGLEKKAKRFRHCHVPFANKPGSPFHPGGELLVCPDKHAESAKYHPYNCGVVGCPLCSVFASAKAVSNYHDPMLALYLAREQASWYGRFWFFTFTYKLEEGEEAQSAIKLVHKALCELAAWVVSTFAYHRKGEEPTEEEKRIEAIRKLREIVCKHKHTQEPIPFEDPGGGFVGSIEVGPKGLEEKGEISQVHGHMFLAVAGETQLGRWVPRIKKGLSVGSTFSLDGDKNKQAIEAKWCELVKRECPVSRIYEIAPWGLDLKFDRETLTKRLEDLGLQGEDLAKAINYNMRATISSAAREILKYATKAYNLKPEAFVEVVKAFDGIRRIFSGGAFFGKKRKRLAAFFAAHVEKYGDPLGREAKPKGCPVCGAARRRMPEAVALASCPELLAAAVRGYLSARRWLDTGDKSAGAPDGKAIRAGPPWLYKYLADLEALAAAPKPQPKKAQAQQAPAPGGEALLVRVGPGALAYAMGI